MRYELGWLEPKLGLDTPLRDDGPEVVFTSEWRKLNAGRPGGTRFVRFEAAPLRAPAASPCANELGVQASLTISQDAMQQRRCNITQPCLV